MIVLIVRIIRQKVGWLGRSLRSEVSIWSQGSSDRQSIRDHSQILLINLLITGTYGTLGLLRSSGKVSTKKCLIAPITRIVWDRIWAILEMAIALIVAIAGITEKPVPLDTMNSKFINLPPPPPPCELAWEFAKSSYVELSHQVMKFHVSHVIYFSHSALVRTLAGSSRNPARPGSSQILKASFKDPGTVFPKILPGVLQEIILEG